MAARRESVRWVFAASLAVAGLYYSNRLSPAAVFVPGLYVQPDGEFDPNRAKNTSGFTTTFNVENTTSSQITASITCGGTGGVTCTNVTPTLPKINAGSYRTITVTYSVGSQGGTIWIEAEGGGYDDQGYKIVTTSPTLTLVTPAITQAPDTARVYNRMPLILATYSAPDATLDTTTLVVRLGNDTVTAITRRNRGLAEWEVDLTRQLTPGSVRELYVKICHTNSACSSITRKVILDNTGAPLVSFSGLPLEHFGGEGEVEASIAIPAYYSYGSAQAPGLVYSTRQSYPRALVNVDLELTWPVGNPDQIKAVLIDGAVRMDSLVTNSPACQAAAGRFCRVTLQGDFSAAAISTRAIRKWLKVEVMVVSGATTKTTVDSVEVVVVDRRGSPYGSGWFANGVTRLDSAGTDMILVGPTGSATLFRGNAGVFISPSGSSDLLRWTGSEWWMTGRPRGSFDATKVVYDGLGRFVAAAHGVGNYIAVQYVGSSIEQVDRITDQANKFVSLTYSSGKLTTFTDPGGRQTKVSINGSNQLVYDSLASNTTAPTTGTFSYTTYGGNNTLVLSSWANALGQTTSVSYDARRRPTQTTLPAVLSDTGSTPLSPVTTERAQVLRGLDTLLSADSIFGQSRNARGFWIRTRLNRWGQATKVWDSLGTLSRAEFVDGRPVWTEGMVPDSTRVYYQHDALGRHLRSFRIRPGPDTVLVDSVVYDGTYDVVVKRYDHLRQATHYSYTTNGQLSRIITPTNDTTRYKYTAAGLLDSVKVPLQGWTNYVYDNTWKNVFQVKSSGVVWVSNTYDAFGRNVESRRKVAVRVVDGDLADTAYYRWRRTITGYTLLNLPDSVRTEMTDECVQPCNNAPAWPSSAADSLRWHRIRYAYDRLGRDTARFNARDQRTRSVYDELGRVRVRVPFADSAAIVDSFRYDLAGNLRFRRTRRGHVIEHRYDARSRDTLMIVPGVGSYRKAFGGPNGGPTRVWIDSYVDSIGGVNPEIRWGYSLDGLLKADTAQGNRVITHHPDRFGRDSLQVDPTGSWRFRYDAVRGMLDTLVTPFGDTLHWTFDARSRALGPYIANGSNPDYSVVPEWDTGGTLVDMTTTHVVTTGHWDLPQGSDVAELNLVPAWYETHGSGGANINSADLLTHDGWRRVTAAAYVKNGNLIATDSVAFTVDGNVVNLTEARSHDAVSSRLLSRSGGGGPTRTYAYDRSGNLSTLSDGTNTWAYSYDALERLVAVRRNDSLVARYAYDVRSRRIAKRTYAASGAAAYLRMIYTGDQVRAETDSVGTTLTTAYTWGPGLDNLIAVHRYANSSDWYTALDPLGSVRGLSKRDGTWAASWRYRIYGGTLDSAGTAPFELRYRWTGREYDNETGFYYFRARYFDPGAARFTQEDPIGLAGGANLYAYGDGNPTDGKDADGLTKNYETMIFRKIAPNSGATVYLDGAPVGRFGGAGTGGPMIPDVAIQSISHFAPNDLMEAADYVTSSERNYTGNLAFQNETARNTYLDLRRAAINAAAAGNRSLLNALGAIDDLGITVFSDPNRPYGQIGTSLDGWEVNVVSEAAYEAGVRPEVALAHELGHALIMNSGFFVGRGLRPVLNQTHYSEPGAFYIEGLARAALGCTARGRDYSQVPVTPC